jgi:6-pyruvoyltetrahydropterin/6-carboxytetrahydropterin synthase
MNVTICKRFTFDAAHWLPHVPKDHKCGRLHGHTYTVEVICSGEVDESGMLIDYADIARAWESVDRVLDHRELNGIAGLENPTTEVLSWWIMRMLLVTLPCLSAVRVYESATTWCQADNPKKAVR